MVTGIGANTQQQQQNVGPVGVPTQIPPAEPVKKPSDNRRSNKPIMEKKRRARINNCLNELKTLILDAMKKDPARHSKLEKADILEMTVKHLENLQRQQTAMTQATDPNVINKFKAGFTECANEVSRFPEIEPLVKRKLLQHLSNCINGVKTEIPKRQTNTVQVRILPSPPSSPEQDHHTPQLSQITATSTGYLQMVTNGTGVQLIPTKLSNGNIAYVIPQTITTTVPSTPVPMLVPIPTRTASASSATSNNSTSSVYERVPREHATSPYHTPPSPANSHYEPMDCQTSLPINHHQQQQQPQQQYVNQHSQQQQPHHHQQHYQTNPNIQLHQQNSMHQQQHLHQIQQQQQQQHLHYQQQQQQQRSYSPAPLSLVMRKSCEPDMKDDEKPWRPW
uniref:Putative deadpan n=1 Tax=Corethrella appendiculata TaxID=1370023 RepID=U5EY94_9DIPT